MTRLIEQQLIKEMNDYLDPLKADYSDYDLNFLTESDVWSTEIYQIGVMGQYKDTCGPDVKMPFILIKLYINDKYKQIYISNLYLPDFMKNKGTRKKLISKIFKVAEEEHYSLFIVNAEYSFYDELIARGALPIEVQEKVVQIVPETRLDD